jgi:hypothetical protein
VSDLAAAAVTLREKLAVLLTNQFGFRVVDIISMTVGRLQLCEGRLWVSGSAFPESRQGVKLNEDLARELSLLQSDTIRATSLQESHVLPVWQTPRTRWS